MNISPDGCAALPPRFFEDGPAVVATRLLGKLLVRHVDGQLLAGMIVETEAYLSADDPAAHGFVGRTKRTEVLFGPAGHAYVHAMRQYHLLDIVTEPAGKPSAVLIRALEPVKGIGAMQRNRKTTTLTMLTNGPARLCQAFKIDTTLNTLDMTNRRSPLFVADCGQNVARELVTITGRIGISKAGDAMLRFFIQGNRFVSRS